MTIVTVTPTSLRFKLRIRGLRAESLRQAMQGLVHSKMKAWGSDLHIGALIIRVGFWGPLYHNYNKEPPKIVLVIIKAA